MAADTFLNWPYPRLRLMERTLPRQAYRDDKPVVIEGNTWAGARYFQESRVYGEQLAKVTRFPVFKDLHTWEASVEGHVPLQQAVGLGLDDKQRARHYFGVYADAKEVLPMLAKLCGYCPFSLEGLIQQGNLRAKVTGLDRAAIVEQAFGLQARQWYEKNSGKGIPAVSYLRGALWEKVEYSSDYVELDEVLFVLSTYRLINQGKLDIKLPPKRVRLYVRGGTLGCEYIDEQGRGYPAPIPTYSAPRLNEAAIAIVRTGNELQAQLQLRAQMDELINSTLSAPSNITEYLSEWVDETLVVVAKLVRDSHEKAMITEAVTRMATRAQSGTKEAVAAMVEFTATYGESLHEGAVKTRKAFLDAYMVVAEDCGKHTEARIAQLVKVETIRAQAEQNLTVWETHLPYTTYMPNNQELFGLPAHCSMVPSFPGNGYITERIGPKTSRLTFNRQYLFDDPNDELVNIMPEGEITFTVGDMGVDDERFNAACRVLGQGGYSYLIPLAFVGITKLYQENFKQTHNGLVGYASIRVKDLINLWRPESVEDFKKKGYKTALSSDKDAFRMVEDVITVLTQAKFYPDPRKEPSRYIDGFYKLMGVKGEGANKEYELRMNDVLLAAMSNQGKLANMFMITLHKALFSYRKRETFHAPAAQWALEQYGRYQMTDWIKHGTTEILTPIARKPIQVLTYLRRFGLTTNKNESLPTFKKRLETTLANVAESGSLKSYHFEKPLDKVQSLEEFAKLGLVPEMADVYLTGYKQHALLREQEAAERELIYPVAQKGQGRKRTYSPDAPARPRGRPPKTT